MTTTIMKDSLVGDAWIKAACDAIPPQWILDDNGNKTSNFLTGPVRLCWTDLMELPKPSPTKQNPKYGTDGLFTPYVDWTIFTEEYYRILAESFSSYRAADGQYYGVHSPFKQQAEKSVKYKGYTPGLVYMTFTSKFKPPVVDTQMQPIVDPSRVYAGAWAVLAVNAYAYGIQPPQPKKGVGFGIQSVMLLGDDMPLTGGAADPRQQFGKVAGSAPAPLVRPDMSQMGRTIGQQPGAAPGMPPMGGSAAPLPPGAPSPAGAPSQNAPLPPGAPGNYTPATPSPTETPEQQFQREMREAGL